jgi:hypothetical protein
MHQRGWRVCDLGSRSLARLALHEIGALSACLLLAEIEGGRQNAGGADKTLLGVQLAVRGTTAPSVRTNEPCLS